MRTILAILLAICASPSPGKSPQGPYPPGVALVLAGGGARGLAHIGFLKALEENDIRVSAIAGTSMGALMAGLYSCGYSAAQLDSLTSGMNWNHLFSSAPEPRLTFLPDRIRGRQDLISLNLRGLTPTLPQSAVTNMRVGFLLSGMTGPAQVLKGFSFDSLRVPLRVVASDLISRDRVFFHKGYLWKYQLASMAIPGVFPPVQADSLLLVDGGMFDNMPVDVARKVWPGMPVLAVDVGNANPVEYPEAPSLFTVTGMTFSALSSRVNEQYYMEPDWLFTPDLHGAQVWSFDETDSLIAWGYSQGMEWIAAQEGLPTGAQERTGWTPPEFVLGNVHFAGNEDVSLLAIDRWLTLSPGDTLSTRSAMEAAENLYASGLFSMVRFSMLPGRERGTADLAYELTERDPGTVGLGLSYNNDFGMDARITVEHANTFNRGIRSIVNTGGGNGYAFAELSSYTNTRERERYFALSAGISQIKGWETDGNGGSSLRTWTDHTAQLMLGRPVSWFGMMELAAGVYGRDYAGTALTQSFPLLSVSALTDTRTDPTSVSPGTRFYLTGGWCPAPRSRHCSLEWDISRISGLPAGLQGGLYTWGSLLWGDNYSWQESRLTASRGIPGYRWNTLPSRERVAGGASLSRKALGPVFLQAELAGSWSFDTFSDYDEGKLHWGTGITARVNIPGGTASLGPGWNDQGDLRWTFSYGSDYSFGPGR
ncbi:MAG TPA: patatin-like phospholipase family protein [Candidatus Sabulitectum sp.]|nr:patatin-like phospholipase family protein [Candidatus Sabulitectum sp.]HPF31649.1 patatin-like phospholipase family protein [Candidatus Sabulitectum sp.]HPR22141.1 patatin-like phospholipase family protein [Candidatus Sabulitectum sp.]